MTKKNKNDSLAACVQRLDAEVDKFKAKAKDLLCECWHKLGDKLTIGEKDARLIRDHEIRSETYRAAARILIEAMSAISAD